MDLKANGKREPLSSHGGCPVLIGSKWILNKLIFYFDQWKNYSCHLNKTEVISPFTGF